MTRAESALTPVFLEENPDGTKGHGGFQKHLTDLYFLK